MSEYYDVLATPRFPLVIRDGRPFGQGGTMKSLPWIYPSSFTGSLRTTLGVRFGLDFSNSEHLDALKLIGTTGALPCFSASNGPYLPKPYDCVVSEKEENGIKRRFVHAVRPGRLEVNEGVDLPYNGKLKSAFLQRGEGEDNFKPMKTAPFWSWNSYMRWLGTENAQGILVGDDNYPQLKDKPKKEHALEAFPKDERTCIEIDSNSGVTTEGQLFSTVGLDFFLKDSRESVALFSRITSNDAFSKITSNRDLLGSTSGGLGGRRRVASWKFQDPTALDAPSDLIENARQRRFVRMILATPAIFERGWLPSWLDENLEGTPPSVHDGQVKLRLESAAIDRWIPVSGWSYERNAPKKVRRMVPEGGVYFFEIVEGDCEALFTDAWFRSVCDDEQDRRDGFGVAFWGVY